MSATEQQTSNTGHVSLRYWASAREAAGTDVEAFEVTGPVALAELLGRARREHGSDRFSRVVDCCSLMVGDRPVTGHDLSEVIVEPGATVELLPPFAGG